MDQVTKNILDPTFSLDIQLMSVMNREWRLGHAIPFCSLTKCACSGSSSSVGKVPINLLMLPVLPGKHHINLSGLLVPEAEGSINLPLPPVSTMKASIALFMLPVPHCSELRHQDLWGIK